MPIAPQRLVILDTGPNFSGCYCDRPTPCFSSIAGGSRVPEAEAQHSSSDARWPSGEETLIGNLIADRADQLEAEALHHPPRGDVVRVRTSDDSSERKMGKRPVADQPDGPTTDPPSPALRRPSRDQARRWPDRQRRSTARGNLGSGRWSGRRSRASEIHRALAEIPQSIGERHIGKLASGEVAVGPLIGPLGQSSARTQPNRTERSATSETTKSRPERDFDRAAEGIRTLDLLHGKQTLQPIALQLCGDGSPRLPANLVPA